MDRGAAEKLMGFDVMELEARTWDDPALKAVRCADEDGAVARIFLHKRLGHGDARKDVPPCSASGYDEPHDRPPSSFIMTPVMGTTTARNNIGW